MHIAQVIVQISISAVTMTKQLLIDMYIDNAKSRIL